MVAPSSQQEKLLVKVTDVTLDIVQAQDSPLVVVVVVVVVLVFLIRAATQLVLHHLRGKKVVSRHGQQLDNFGTEDGRKRWAAMHLVPLSK